MKSKRFSRQIRFIKEMDKVKGGTREKGGFGDES